MAVHVVEVELVVLVGPLLEIVLAAKKQELQAISNQIGTQEFNPFLQSEICNYLPHQMNSTVVVLLLKGGEDRDVPLIKASKQLIAKSC